MNNQQNKINGDWPKEPVYVITQVHSDRLFWSNTDGWCDNTRSLFSLEETETFNLPMGGVWVLLNE